MQVVEAEMLAKNYNHRPVYMYLKFSKPAGSLKFKSAPTDFALIIQTQQEKKQYGVWNSGEDIDSGFLSVTLHTVSRSLVTPIKD